MADTDTSPVNPAPHAGLTAGPGSATSTVAGAQTAAGPTAVVPAPAFESWLAALSPAQLRTVLAMYAADLDFSDLPAAYQQQALGLAPQAAQLAAAAAVEAYGAGSTPPLVELPDGRIYYSAGGEQYRQVPDAATFDGLDLTMSAVVRVDTLTLPQAAPWAAPVSPADAYTAAGRIIAGRGSVGAAYSFAATWRGRIG